MPPTYNLTEDPTRATSQATDRTLRRKWQFAPFSNNSNVSELKAWLKNNTICAAPIPTPPDLAKQLEILKVSLGDPAIVGHDFARVSTVRIKKGFVTSGPTRRTTYKPKERYDYQRHESEQNFFVAEACTSITLRFLKLTPCGEFLSALFDTNNQVGKRNVYVHVDWYPLREYKQVGFHKDTHGSTLFVGLIYMNEAAIPGPDIIDNPWPLRERENTNKPTQRCYLPDLIKAPIDQILEENQRTSPMRVRQTGEIPAGGGIVWFIDELVHHSTPYPTLPQIFTLAIGAKQITPNLQNVQKPTDWKPFTRSGSRQFVRIWVTLEEAAQKNPSKPKAVTPYIGELELG
jgi:hypothetical protein